VTLSGAYLVDGTTATIDGGTFESATADQAVFLVVNGGRLTITNARIAKAGDATSSGQHGVDDSYSFYGLNSAVVVVGQGSSVTVSETTLTTDASGANAVVATGSANATVTSCAIATTGESSRGLHATYAGVITGSDLTIETQGAHCAALATDRGSGTVAVDGTNTFTTNGDGSPCLYSTGQITVSGLTGQANASQAVVVEGKNHATVSSSTLTSASTKGGVMLYQSMSGDAADAEGGNQLAVFGNAGHFDKGHVHFAEKARANLLLDMRQMDIHIGGVARIDLITQSGVGLERAAQFQAASLRGCSLKYRWRRAWRCRRAMAGIRFRALSLPARMGRSGAALRC